MKLKSCAKLIKTKTTLTIKVFNNLTLKKHSKIVFNIEVLETRENNLYFLTFGPKKWRCYLVL